MEIVRKQATRKRSRHRHHKALSLHFALAFVSECLAKAGPSNICVWSAALTQCLRRRKYLAQIFIRLIRNLSRIRDSASHKFEYD
jgi:hypothetical protein